MKFQVIHGIHIDTEKLKPRIIKRAAALGSKYTIEAMITAMETCLDDGPTGTSAEFHKRMVQSGLWDRIAKHRFELGLPVEHRAVLDAGYKQVDHVIESFWDKLVRGQVDRRVKYRTHDEEILEVNLGDFTITYSLVEDDPSIIKIYEVVGISDNVTLRRENRERFERE